MKNEAVKHDKSEALRAFAASEDRGLAAVAIEFEALARDWPLWLIEFESVPPWLATRAELAYLAETAPTPFARGLIHGWLSARCDVANQTGVSFS